jgi:hypothetical protein
LNWTVLTDLITELDASATKKSGTTNLHWTGVSRNIVAKFLEEYSAHRDQALRTNSTAKFIRNQHENILKTWDVVCVRYVDKTKASIKEPVNGNNLHVLRRKATEYDEQRLYVKRIGGPTDESLDLTTSDRAKLEKNFGKKSTYTGAEYRSVRDISRGLLLIYVIADPNGKEHPYGGPKDKFPSDRHYVGFVVSFPEDKSNSFKAEEVLANDIAQATWFD